MSISATFETKFVTTNPHITRSRHEITNVSAKSKPYSKNIVQQSGNSDTISLSQHGGQDKKKF
jgi:hypothetical protein